MSDVELGKIIIDKPQKDAIHVAVAPVIAAVRLSPGEHVGLTEKNGDQVARPSEMGPNIEPIGIVDPFLDRDVFPGQRLWLMLYPNTVMSLRHEWVHPAFGGDSVRWLEDIADECNFDYADILHIGHEFIRNGHYTLPSDNAKDVLNSNNEEFWHHFEVVTGKRIKNEDTTFNCAC